MDEPVRLPRMRTAQQAMDEIRKMDPNTAIKTCYIRRIMNANAVPVITSGNRKFVNLDVLIEYFASNPSLDITPQQTGEIRRIPERIRT